MRQSAHRVHPGRLVRLALMRRFGVQRAAELMRLPVETLRSWLRERREAEGREHLPHWRQPRTPAQLAARDRKARERKHRKGAV